MLKKTIYHTINIMFTEAELFLIRCGINQAIESQNVEKIIIITNVLYATRHIFNLFCHPYQLHSIAVSINFRAFFSKSSSNSIVLWDYPSSAKWPLHLMIDKETRWFKINFIFPCKLSWDFSKKEEYDSILQ